mmetsp:Transcript_25063/g.70190  ORF Transcript_25063/g.70190 Transcript_25063/m.70190 type:complete len:261 (-) Transcript_25063:222-1004(-)
MPSSSALWASMGPSMRSPMAYTPGTLVAKVAGSTTTRPRSVFTPASSRPRPSVNGRRPMATSTTSASTVSASPPAAGSTVSLTPSAVFSAAVTLLLYLKLRPCFFSTRSKARLTSLSMAGTMRSRNSMTSTSAPRRLHTLPISRPMIPPPMTTIFLGTFFSARAPVELTTVSSSMSTPGSGVTSLPVARMMCFPFSTCSDPSSAVTATSPWPARRPQPLTYVTLFFLKRPSMPLVSPSTAESFWSIILPMSIFTPVTCTP